MIDAQVRRNVFDPVKTQDEMIRSEAKLLRRLVRRSRKTQRKNLELRRLRFASPGSRRSVR